MFHRNVLNRTYPNILLGAFMLPNARSTEYFGEGVEVVGV